MSTTVPWSRFSVHRSGTLLVHSSRDAWIVPSDSAVNCGL